MAKKSKRSISGIVYSTDPDFSIEAAGKEEDTLPPEQQLLRVKRDTKHRAGKIVTIVEGFTGKKEDLDALGKLLKTKCGTGGSVKDGIVIIQGDCREQVLNLLKAMGYPVKL